MELRQQIAGMLANYLPRYGRTTNAEKLADKILALPDIAEALDWWQMNLDYQRRFHEEELAYATAENAKQSLAISAKPDR
jgi:hypothetical protein